MITTKVLRNLYKLYLVEKKEWLEVRLWANKHVNLVEVLLHVIQGFVQMKSLFPNSLL